MQQYIDELQDKLGRWKSILHSSFFFYLPCRLNFLQTFNITGSIFFFSCADALEKRKFFSGLHTTDFDVNKFKEKNWWNMDR